MCEKIYLGEKVVVSDPCYTLDVWCMGILENVKEGIYFCSYEREKSENRIDKICVKHENYNNEPFEKTSLDIGVDSGQAGIFDFDYYQEKQPLESWYEDICNKTGGYVPNENYVKFKDSKAFNNECEKLKKALNKLAETHKDLNIDDIYDRITSQYKIPDYEGDHLSYGELAPILRNFRELLKEKTELIKTPEEKDVLDVVTLLHEQLFHLLLQYDRTFEGQRTIYQQMATTVDDKGFVSSSCWGDGMYDCYIAKDKDGKIVAIKILFNE